MCPKRSTLLSYYLLYLVIVICIQRKLILHEAKWMGCCFETERKPKVTDWDWEDCGVKNSNCKFYSCLSDTIKHSLESLTHGNSRFTLNLLMVQLSKFIWWIYHWILSWLCENFYLTQMYRLSVLYFFIIL